MFGRRALRSLALRLRLARLGEQQERERDEGGRTLNSAAGHERLADRDRSRRRDQAGGCYSKDQRDTADRPMLTQFIHSERLVLGWDFRKSAGFFDRPRALKDTASLVEAALQKSEQRRVRHQAEQPEVRLCPQGGYCNGHAAEREARNSPGARVNFCGDAITSDARVGERVGRRRRRWRRHGRRRRGRAGPGCSAWPGSAVPRAVHWLQVALRRMSSRSLEVPGGYASSRSPAAWMRARNPRGVM